MTVDETVKEIVAIQLGIDKDDIKSSDPLSDLGADSLDMIEIVIEVEERYAIDILEVDSGDFKTVEDIVKYLAENHNITDQ